MPQTREQHTIYIQKYRLRQKLESLSEYLNEKTMKYEIPQYDIISKKVVIYVRNPEPIEQQIVTLKEQLSILEAQIK